MTVKRSVKPQDSIAGAVGPTFEREEELLDFFIEGTISQDSRMAEFVV